MSDIRYVTPGFFTTRVFNRLVALLTRLGINIAGAEELSVRGRSSGEWRTTPVNPLTVDGVRYLVAPRGQTQWVRNIRVSGGGRLRKGRRTEEITVVEVADADKLPVLRQYLVTWAWEVGQFFEGIDKTSSDEELLAAAPGFPVFRIS
jgi:deazaflavin-dependent oxidoreductase (nitroreductase family)